jgi:estrogen-related receptor beta like 1
MWENSLEKLKILNYENTFCKKFNRKPFNRVHFVHATNNASHQFEDFSAICSWLCTEITMKNDTFKPEQYDDPNTVVNKLVLALRQFDYRSTFPAQKLKTPYGEPVCIVLEFLTDKALEAKGFQWGTPVHLNDQEVSLSLSLSLSLDGPYSWLLSFFLFPSISGGTSPG